jgi:hypothetical protein
MRAEEIKGLIEAYSKVHETPEILNEAAKPNPNDLGYRAGRGIVGALSDLGPGLAGQLTGKDNPALQRQRARTQKLQQLVTTGKLDTPTSAAKPTRQNPAVQQQIAKNEKDRRTMNPGDYFGTNPEKPKPSPGPTGSPGPGSNRPGPSGSPGSNRPPVSTTVLAKKGGVEGKLDKSTGKFTAGAFSAAEKSRYASVAAKNTGASTAAEKPSSTPTTPQKPAGSAMDQWRKANPKLAAAADEKSRIRGTSQTDNPLMKDMRSKMSMTPSVQSPTLAKDLGKGGGNQSLLNNPNASKAAPPKPAATAAPKPIATAKPSGFDLAKKGVNLAAGVDIFDIVKGHLLDEGYAETEQNAIVMMANMSEEWRDSIIMELTGGKGHPGYKAGSKDHGPMEAGHPADSEKRKDKGGTMSMRHGHHLGDMDDEDDDDDDLESVVKQQSRDSRERVRKPLRDKVKAARKKMTKEEMELDEAQKARENPEGHDKEEKRKYEPVRGERTPMPPRGDKRREDFEKWYRANVR